MFDCVFPTRTARFGWALTRQGILKLKKTAFKKDFSPIDKHWKWWVWKTYTRAFISMQIDFS